MQPILTSASQSFREIEPLAIRCVLRLPRLFLNCEKVVRAIGLSVHQHLTLNDNICLNYSVLTFSTQMLLLHRTRSTTALDLSAVTCSALSQFGVGCCSHYASGGVWLLRWLPSSSDLHPCTISLQSNVLEYFLAIYHTISATHFQNVLKMHQCLSVLKAWLVIGCWTVRTNFTLI